MILNDFFNSKNLQPTQGQQLAISKIANFINPENDDWIFILKGFAGTGKTTLISVLVEFLKSIHYPFVLMAPTGRAAKVMQQYANNFASTIHRKIYRKQAFFTGGFKFLLAPNQEEFCLFIIDEASMIGSKTEGFSGNSFLDDILSFVANGAKCKVLFVGDTAQLSPVGSLISPALSSKMLAEYSLKVIEEIELTQVLRQELNSGILNNATLLRQFITSNKADFPKLDVINFQDIQSISGPEVQEFLEMAYSNFGMEETIIISRSNKVANIYNQQVRNRILYFEEELSGGDLLMVVKNNYHWINADDKIYFLANGEIVEIQRIIKEFNLYGFQFFDLEVVLKDHPDLPILEIRVVKESLYADGPSLSEVDYQKLYNEVEKDYLHISDKKARIKKIMEDPFFNAVQVKFAYAITGHKSQGGQWDCVFVDQSFFKPEMLSTDYLRWLYTAFTRAKKQLYLVNFNPNFFT